MIIRGDRDAARRLRAVGARAKNVEEAWPNVGNMLATRISRQFLTEGAYFGTKWRKLKPATIVEKRRQGWPTKTLQRTGELKKSFTGRPMNIEEYFPQSARFGSSLDKAVWHQRGTYRNGKRVNPPRKMIVITAEVRRETKDILRRYILKKGL